jgi:single-strand DNA-binding protein
MPNLNELHIKGHLGRDPERREYNGSPVTSFSVAVGNDYKDRKTGEWVKRDSTWFNCTVWGSLGNAVAMGFSKGDAIEVWGKVSARTYQGNDGSQRVSLDVRVDRVSKPVYVKRGEPSSKAEQFDEYGFPISLDEVRGDGDEIDIPF